MALWQQSNAKERTAKCKLSFSDVYKMGEPLGRLSPPGHPFHGSSHINCEKKPKDC